MAGTDAPEGASRETQGHVWWDITWRLLLIIIGIPAVWILRAAGIVNLSLSHAVGLSVILLLIAVGQQFLALVLST
ncbi:hypothetical protein [Mycolicibacterium fortuitum]|uniref:hypothetical protein n=1 Tax=Mycolicibacterium fortuitum TaxID=1766 RepID=UPI003AAE6D90